VVRRRDGVIAYMLGAIAAHVRVGDRQGITSPLLPLVLAIAALVTRMLSL
jgi:hypothetical protein